MMAIIIIIIITYTQTFLTYNARYILYRYIYDVEKLASQGQ